MLGEASITETPGIIFNMTPSPGATSCLGNAERDAKLICNYLGMEFNEDKFFFRIIVIILFLFLATIISKGVYHA